MILDLLAAQRLADYTGSFHLLSKSEAHSPVGCLFVWAILHHEKGNSNVLMRSKGLVALMYCSTYLQNPPFACDTWTRASGACV